MEKKEKIAVILFNLGGPDSLKSVKPFLFNLFSDKNIIPLPLFFRYPLAWFISTLRNKKAQKIYEKLGGKSPIYEETLSQSNALQKIFTQFYPQTDYKIFISMRYWFPRLEHIIEDIRKENFDKIILLPLYPQFSTTTTKSSFEEWDILWKREKSSIPVEKICCYPQNDGFTQSYAQLISEKLENTTEKTEIIFSAHGIPQECVDKGDPYEEHVKKSVDKIVGILKEKYQHFNAHIAYQSKVGPKKWLLPNTEDLIVKFSEEKRNLMIVPIAFVSEHSETLVELDMDYKELALAKGVKSYMRIPALGTQEIFIDGLAKIVEQAKNGEKFERVCSQEFCECYLN